MAPVSVLIVNYRSTDWLLPCLESLLRNAPELRRVVVVENASGDGSAERISAWAAGREAARSLAPACLRSLWHPAQPKPLALHRIAEGGAVDPAARLVLIEANANRGFAAGNNIGLRHIEACGDASDVWLLNPDTLVAPGTLAALQARMAADPDIGTCGAELRYLERPDRVQCLAGAWFQPRTGRARHLGEGEAAGLRHDAATVERRLGYVIGACLLATRAYLDHVGPMDERFFLYFEEAAWQARAANAGRRFRAGFAPAAVVYHHHHASGGRHERYLLAGRLRFARYYRPWSLPTVAAAVVVAAFRARRRGETARLRVIASPAFWWEALLRAARAPAA
ncbi:MAG: glycosyltransferase [Alphaproteobacteria bacterium]|nr:glycosyltransferase [Alphaproteobacteria bacterium]MCB9929315.1 glycosyltransferase [Alphaproteobacteria bacterium]